MKEIDKYMTPSEAAFYWRIPRETIKNKYSPSLMNEKQINDLERMLQ
ncbi:DNA-binding protein, partial [Bacillus cereus group sp. N8]|nr:DNA-binding protein [Bacillus cereus group sp. N8]